MLTGRGKKPNQWTEIWNEKSKTSLSLDPNDTLSGGLEYVHSEDQAIRKKFCILKNRLITESGIASNVSSGMLVFKLPFERLL